MKGCNRLLAGLLMFGLSVAPLTPVFAEESIIPEPASLEPAPSVTEATAEVATTTPEEVVPETLPLVEASTIPTLLDTILNTAAEEATSTIPAALVPEEQIEAETVIVKFKDTAVNLETTSGKAESEEVASEEGAIVEEHLESANIAVVSSENGESVESLAEELSQNPAVEYAEPNYARTLDVIDTNDTNRGLQWALENTGQSVNGTTGTIDADIDGKEAWELSTGTSTIVAVIDTGVLYTHGDLANQMWNGASCVSETGAALGGCNHGYDFQTNDTTPLPELRIGTSSYEGYHGTHVAGIIAAEMNNATGTIGIAPNAKIMALKFGLDVASEIRAIDFARLNGARIINASFGGTTFSQGEYDAIARFRDAGGIFIASAGNGGTDVVGDSNDTTPVYPASYDLSNIIAVAATDQNDALTTFSNFGATSVDIAAPGRRILSTYTTDGSSTGYDYLSGTSMAAPYVAGTVALARSLYPTATTTALKNALLQSGDSLGIYATTTSQKRLNARRFLEVLAPGDTEAPVITLIGDAAIALTVGDTYTEQGATTTDNVDTSVAIVIEGAVNTTTAGAYGLTYNATDAAGNQATPVTRTVTVAAAPVASSGGGGGGGGGGGSSKSKNKSKTTKKASTTVKKTTPVANPAKELHTPKPAGPAPAPQVAGASSYTFTANLTTGSRGQDVTELQNLLTRQGFYQGPVTGYFGPLTATSLRAYQQAKGLAATGSIDASTKSLLNQGTSTASVSTNASMQTQLATLLALVAQLQAKLKATQAVQ